MFHRLRILTCVFCLMPPWLAELLAKHQSQGFLDSLSTLVGTQPNFTKVPDRSNRGSPVGALFDLINRQPTIGITPFTIRNFGNQGAKNYPGYKGVDKEQLLGDQVLGHEFGHVATMGSPNYSLSSALLELEPGATQGKAKEEFADNFQNAVQFLRSHKTDTKDLNPKSQAIVSVLLKFDPYKDHPINQMQEVMRQALEVSKLPK